MKKKEKDMQKSLSYLLPLVALLILVMLVFRWYNSIRPEGEVSGSAEGIEITDLTSDDQAPLGVEDSISIPLEPNEEVGQYQGEIRLGNEPDESGSTPFSISASLPELEDGEGFYQVWFEGEKGRKKAMRLSYKKGGYMGEGKLSSEFTSLKMTISKEMNDDDEIEEVMMEGTVNLDSTETQEVEN